MERSRFRSAANSIAFSIDAPCSGTGTLGRNPEIKWRLQPSDLADLHAKQVALVRQALEHLCPGGRLVYSTCSLEPEENEQVIQEIPGPWQTTERLPGLNRRRRFFRRGVFALGEANIEHRQPILQRLQREAAKHQPDTEHAHAPLRQIVGVVFDVRTERHSKAGHQAGHHSQSGREEPGMGHVAHHRAAQERCRDVTAVRSIVVRINVRVESRPREIVNRIDGRTPQVYATTCPTVSRTAVQKRETKAHLRVERSR